MLRKINLLCENCVNDFQKMIGLTLGLMKRNFSLVKTGELLSKKLLSWQTLS